MEKPIEKARSSTVPKTRYMMEEPEPEKIKAVVGDVSRVGTVIGDGSKIS